MERKVEIMRERVGDEYRPYRTRRVPMALGLDEEKGEIEGYAAIMGFPDAYNEIIDNGAFKKTLREHKGRIALCWQHDFREPIGKPSILREVGRDKLPEELLKRFPKATGGLYFKCRIADTRRGRDAKALMREGVVDEMSIGFDVPKGGHYDGEDGYVHLSEIFPLYEISPVTLAAMPAATVIEYKGAIPPDVRRLDVIPGEAVYVKTGDGHEWVADWEGFRDSTISPEWRLVGDADPCLVKVEETEDTIRVPNPGVGDCDVTATITISAEEGIKALYCGKVKKVRTFLFAKAKGWTVAKAVAWVKEHADEHKEAELSQPAQGQAEALALWIRVQEASLELGASNAPGG